MRCAPYRIVNVGDTVYLKESGGLVKGMFSVNKVDTYDNLTHEDLIEIDFLYGKYIFAHPYENPAWEKWEASKYATLIHITDPVRFDEPFEFKKRDQRAWLVLDSPLHDR